MFSVSLYLVLGFLTIQKGQQAATLNMPTGTIEGRVVRAADGEPLRKAWVTARKAQGEGRAIRAYTDAMGRFVLKDLEPAQYRLWVDRNGYVSQPYGQVGSRGMGATITLGPGQSLRGIEVRMIPAGSVSGRVYDEDGEPMASARIEALRYMYSEGKRSLVPGNMGMTNDLGEYRIFGLGPGRYYLRVTYAPWDRPALAGSKPGVETEPGTESAYAPTYYPGTNDLARAAALDLSTGEELVGMDFNLLPTHSVKIRGRVFNAAAGKPGYRAMVALMPRDVTVRTFGFSSENFVDDPQGNFEIRGVTPGSYFLTVNSWDGEKSYTARVPVDVGAADLEGVNVTVNARVDIPGRLQWEGLGQAKASDVSINLQPRQEMMWSSGGSGNVKADGRFTLKNVGDGEYRVVISGEPEDCYLKSARYGGEDTPEDGVTISGGKLAGSLEVVLDCSGARVEGDVLKDQAPFSGAHVVLVPEPDRRGQTELYRETTTDQYGRFVLRGIAPGKYKAFAWEQVEYGAYQDPDFLKSYEDHGEPVEVGEGGRQTLQLKLIPADARQP